MSRHTASALMITTGAFLLVLPSLLFDRSCAAPQKVAALNSSQLPDGAVDVISFCELPLQNDDGFRYCEITIAGENGVPRKVTLRAKKSLVTDSIKCSIKDIFW